MLTIDKARVEALALAAARVFADGVKQLSVDAMSEVEAAHARLEEEQRRLHDMKVHISSLLKQFVTDPNYFEDEKCCTEAESQEYSSRILADGGSRLPLTKLVVGCFVCGRVVRRTESFVFLDIGAEYPGKLRLPTEDVRKCRKGDIIKDLIIETVNVERQKIGLRFPFGTGPLELEPKLEPQKADSCLPPDVSGDMAHHQTRSYELKEENDIPFCALSSPSVSRRTGRHATDEQNVATESQFQRWPLSPDSRRRSPEPRTAHGLKLGHLASPSPEPHEHEASYSPEPRQKHQRRKSSQKMHQIRDQNDYVLDPGKISARRPIQREFNQCVSAEGFSVNDEVTGVVSKCTPEGVYVDIGCELPGFFRICKAESDLFQIGDGFQGLRIEDVNVDEKVILLRKPDAFVPPSL